MSSLPLLLLCEHVTFIRVLLFFFRIREVCQIGLVFFFLVNIILVLVFVRVVVLISLAGNVDTSRVHAQTIGLSALHLIVHDLLESPLLGSQSGHLLLHVESLGVLLLLLKVLQSSSLLLVALTRHVLAPLLPVLATVVLLIALLMLMGLCSLILLTVKELIADAEVLLHGVHEIGEAIVVSINLHATRNERVNPIIMAHHLDVPDDAKARRVLISGCL